MRSVWNVDTAMKNLPERILILLLLASVMLAHYHINKLMGHILECKETHIHIYKSMNRLADQIGK